MRRLMTSAEKVYLRLLLLVACTTGWYSHGSALRHATPSLHNQLTCSCAEVLLRPVWLATLPGLLHVLLQVLLLHLSQE
jgi:hypothetical protein